MNLHWNYGILKIIEQFCHDYTCWQANYYTNHCLMMSCLLSVVKTLYALALLVELKVYGCKAVLYQEDHQLT